MTQLVRKAFFGPEAQLREGWWVVLFLAGLLVALAPVLIWSAQSGREVSLAEQAVLILIVTWACQRLRRRPLSAVTGGFEVRWAVELSLGAAAGAMIMLVPATILQLGGSIEWQVAATPLPTIADAVAAMLLVAVAEELLFRGFLFQRLLAAVGIWPAQMLIGGLFLLTHLQNPGMTGVTKWIAGANIFAASLLFGWAYLRTRSLALPIGLHWMANVVQGPVLGLGVSGNSTTGALEPRFISDAQWWTGGSFGLEASVPGTICVVAAIILIATPGRARRGRSPPLMPRVLVGGVCRGWLGHDLLRRLAWLRIGVLRRVRPCLGRCLGRGRRRGLRLGRLFQRLLRVHPVLGGIFQDRGGRRVGLLGGIFERAVVRTAASGEQQRQCANQGKLAHRDPFCGPPCQHERRLTSSVPVNRRSTGRAARWGRTRSRGGCDRPGRRRCWHGQRWSARRD